MVLPFPNFASLNGQFTDVEVALNDTNYEDAITLTTSAIDHLVHTMNVAHCALLDKRVQARVMRKEYISALQDSERMIEILPTLGAGYLRAGEVYMELLSPAKAIVIYDRGIENVPSFDPQYTQLLESKSEAKRRDKHVDFIHMLPINILSNIFQRLPIPTRATCARLSKEWRKQILGSPGLWTTANCHDNSSARTVDILSHHIGANVKHLTLTGKSISPNIMAKHLSLMARGSLKNLQFLSITALPAELFENEAILPILKRLEDLRQLYIVLDDDPSQKTQVMTLAEILNSCPRLTDLRYFSNCPLDVRVGDLDSLIPHYPLINLELKHTSIELNTLRLLLTKCPSIRRLTLVGCDSQAIAIIGAYCPNLEILGYNKSTVPELSDAERRSNPKGLRTVWFPHNGKFECSLPFIPLLYKNMETVEDLEVKFSDITDSSKIEHLNQLYLDFKLSKLKRLTTWFKSDAMRVLLPAVAGCTTLTDLTIKSVGDYRYMVEALLTIPHLNRLAIEDRITVKPNGSLRRLFQEYRLLKYGLERLELRRSRSVDDVVLNSILGLPNLKEVVIVGCHSITLAGFGNFVDQLRRKTDQTLVSMELTELDSVRDWSIQQLARVPNLRSVELKRLKWITSEGIIKLASSISPGESSLKQLTVTKCFNRRETTDPTLQELKIPGCCFTVT